MPHCDATSKLLRCELRFQTEKTGSSSLFASKNEHQVMDDRRFDSLARSLADGPSRRTLLKSMLGIAGAAIAGSAMTSNDAQAARRGFSGPKVPTPCVPNCAGSQCGSDGCGGTCGDCHSSSTCFQGICYGACDPVASPCCSACECDPINLICVTPESMGASCSAARCPAGWYCDQSNICRRDCGCGA